MPGKKHPNVFDSHVMTVEDLTTPNAIHAMDDAIRCQRHSDDGIDFEELVTDFEDGLHVTHRPYNPHDLRDVKVFPGYAPDANSEARFIPVIWMVPNLQVDDKFFQAFNNLLMARIATLGAQWQQETS